MILRHYLSYRNWNFIFWHHMVLHDQETFYRRRVLWNILMRSRHFCFVCRMSMVCSCFLSSIIYICKPLSIIQLSLYCTADPSLFLCFSFISHLKLAIFFLFYQSSRHFVCFVLFLFQCLPISMCSVFLFFNLCRDESIWQLLKLDYFPFYTVCQCRFQGQK